MLFYGAKHFIVLKYFTVQGVLAEIAGCLATDHCNNIENYDSSNASSCN